MSQWHLGNRSNMVLRLHVYHFNQSLHPQFPIDVDNSKAGLFMYRNTSPIRQQPIWWITRLKYRNVSIMRHHAPTFSAFQFPRIGKTKARCFPNLFFSKNQNKTLIWKGDIAWNVYQCASLLKPVIGVLRYESVCQGANHRLTEEMPNRMAVQQIHCISHHWHIKTCEKKAKWGYGGVESTTNETPLHSTMNLPL